MTTDLFERPVVAAPWFPVDMMRIANRPCRIRVGGVAFTGLYKGPPVETKRPRWVGIGVDRSFVDLRGEPDAWQPLSPGDWPGYGPHWDSRMVRIDAPSFDAIELAEIKAERADMRHAAYARDSLGEPGEPEPLPSWRDADSITYSAAPHISRDEAEARVMRALYFLGGPGGLDLLGYRSNAAVMSDLKRAADSVKLLTGFGYSEADARAELKMRHNEALSSGSAMPRLMPTLSDTPERLIAAMRWATELRLSPKAGSVRYRVLELRSRNTAVTWADVGEMNGNVSATRARQLYASAIDRIGTIANHGTPLLDHITATTIKANREHANVR
jgi:hypothetical protein